MFKHILVPLDGSALAESVLPAVAYLSQTLNAMVTLVHVIEKDAPAQIHGQSHLTDPEKAQAYLQEIILTRLPARVIADFHVHSAEVKNVAHSIIVHVGEFAPDLIVMSTHGRGGLHRSLFGSIALQLISLGVTPVLIIQPDPQNIQTTFKCQRLLVPLDGNPEHERGLQIAAELAQNCQAEMNLLLVAPTIDKLSGNWTSTSRLLPGTTSRLLDFSAEDAEEYLSGLQKPLQEKGLNLQADVLRGEPASIISDAAQQLQIDLIVLGTHGVSKMEAFWEGSLTPRLCSKCRIPLLLAPIS